MSHRAHWSEKAPVSAPRQSAQKNAPIYLDRDALRPRGWLSRRGRKLLERPDGLLISAGRWLDDHITLAGLPPGAQMNCGA